MKQENIFIKYKIKTTKEGRFWELDHKQKFTFKKNKETKK